MSTNVEYVMHINFNKSVINYKNKLVKRLSFNCHKI
jgi:hypothetical protein